MPKDACCQHEDSPIQLVEDAEGGFGTPVIVVEHGALFQ